jgi:hypothetical protein
VEPKVCHYCAKTIHKDNEDYTLKESFILKGKLRCDYINNDGNSLNDYKKGIKTKFQCVYGLSIGLSIAGVLLICSICVLKCCMCTALSGGSCDYDNDVYIIDGLGYIKVSDIIFGACWPFIMCIYCIIEGIPKICQCIKDEVDEYIEELDKLED